MSFPDKEIRRLIRNIGYTMIYIDSVENDADDGNICAMEMMRDCLFAIQDAGFNVDLDAEDVIEQNKKILQIIESQSDHTAVGLGITREEFDDFVRDVEAAIESRDDINAITAEDIKGNFQSLHYFFEITPKNIGAILPEYDISRQAQRIANWGKDDGKEGVFDGTTKHGNKYGG